MTSYSSHTLCQSETSRHCYYYHRTRGQSHIKQGLTRKTHTQTRITITKFNRFRLLCNKMSRLSLMRSKTPYFSVQKHFTELSRFSSAAASLQWEHKLMSRTAMICLQQIKRAHHGEWIPDTSQIGNIFIHSNSRKLLRNFFWISTKCIYLWCLWYHLFNQMQVYQPLLTGSSD